MQETTSQVSASKVVLFWVLCQIWPASTNYYDGHSVEFTIWAIDAGGKRHYTQNMCLPELRHLNHTQMRRAGLCKCIDSCNKLQAFVS